MLAKQEARFNKMLQLGFDLISKVPAKKTWSKFSLHQQAEVRSDAIVLNKIIPAQN